MHPYLFDWIVAGHHLKPPSYGVMLAIAFTAGYLDSLRRAIKIDSDPKQVENLFLTVVLASVIGARLFHVFFEEWPYYAANPGKIIAIWEGGYTLYGAMLSAILAMFLYVKIKKVDYLEYMDIAAPAAMLGLFFGRIGCFLAGCCWGRETDVPWAVTFTNPEAFTSARNIPLHPSQLYESFAGLLIYLYLNWRFRNRRFEGQIFFHGLLLYSIARFVIEFFRGDDYRGYLFHGALSYSQLVSLGILPFAVYSRVRKTQPKMR
jgi:phosphatidylglycerol---prolipoprotein diacylglyceryl transferase